MENIYEYKTTGKKKQYKKRKKKRNAKRNIMLTNNVNKTYLETFAKAQ